MWWQRGCGLLKKACLWAIVFDDVGEKFVAILKASFPTAVRVYEGLYE